LATALKPHRGDPRLVPTYAITNGRTRSAGEDLPWETILTTTDVGLASRSQLRFEHARIIDLCQRPVSVAEVGAVLGVPIGVARVLVSDLKSDGLLTVHRPTLAPTGSPRTEVLERLLVGLRKQQT
jgi:hypothetical protein